jgi:hypothetical protein
VEVPKGLGGRSVRPLVEGRKVPDWPDEVVTECCLNDPGPTGRMVRTKRFKYMAYSEGHNREMLVDLETDPGEMFNLAGNPDLKYVLAEHRSRLMEWCALTGDKFNCVPPGVDMG